MLYNHQIEVPVKCIQGRLFLRISAHVYNDMNDYYRLTDVVNLLKN